jgi:hypothetical protein
MISQSAIAKALALGMAASLSGCYVVPVDTRYPYDPARPYTAQPVVQQPLVLPVAPPVPVLMQARLYPANDVAGKMGALSATVTDTLNGHATFNVIYGGETMQGEASRVANDSPEFGRVHRMVFGDGRMPSGRRGIASAAGARGTYVNCEYALTAATVGTGACVFSNGAMYQMHFGA